jgi:hypothetical protein
MSGAIILLSPYAFMDWQGLYIHLLPVSTFSAIKVVNKYKTIQPHDLSVLICRLVTVSMGISALQEGLSSLKVIFHLIIASSPGTM